VGIETFGRVAAEAHARGTPVVATAHGGFADIVDDPSTGILIPPGDPVALASAVRTLWDDPARLADMRTAARRRFLENYSSSIALQRWEDLYDRVVAERKRA
jgi:glycosyltransferase involved in cell wall biosynthesis